MRIRTGYSFRTAVGHLDEVISRLKELGHTVAPITDRNSTFGYRRFRDACKKENIKPVYGVEIGVIERVEKKPIINYWTFLAINDIRDVNRLIGKASRTTIKEPALFLHDARKAQGVIKIIGERATFNQMLECKGFPDTYLALSPSTPKKTVEAARLNNIPLIAVSDNYFPRKEDFNFYSVALGRRSSAQTYPTHILSDDEWKKAVQYIANEDEIASALENRNIILTLNADLQNAEMYKPVREKTLLEMCEEGAIRTGTDLTDPVYAARLERELKVIEEKDFSDYFYIVADIVNWAKDRMIVGPARGSSCGSLVCYLLNITTVDPIPYGLIFERFIDINRKDMPDIDIDFSDKQRDLVFGYMQERYNTRDVHRVARLGTVGFFKQRSALKQVGAVLKIPIGMIEKAITASEDVLSLKETFDTTDAGQKLVGAYPAVRIAERLENHPNVASQHAAGMLVTQEDIVNYVAMDEKTHAAMVDKKDAEILNLLKIDALGLTQLSVFERALTLMGYKNPSSGILEKLIPLDDQKAFDILNEGRFAGIFQFAGRALQGLTKEVTVDNLEDIVSITALARPGPMSAGGAASWVKRRSNKEEVSAIHPLMMELTKETYGVIVYQEQVMQIVRQIGNMSWEDTSDIRRAIGKSMGSEALEKYYVKFREGALENGVEDHVARQIWDAIITFGRYGFNRSHAVAYGIVSYYCCWLKAHYPMEFCAATLDAEDDPLKQLTLLRELKEEGIDYVPMDLKKSTEHWEVSEEDGVKKLVGPLTVIKGLGSKFVQEIIGARVSGEPLRPALQKRLENAKTGIDTLYPIKDAAWRGIEDIAKAMSEPDKHWLRRELRAKKDISSIRPSGSKINVVAVLRRLTVKDENDEASRARRKSFGRKEFFDGQTNWLSMFFADDTDEIFVKIGTDKFETLGKEIMDRGGVGSSIYFLQGYVPDNFRMINVDKIVYMGKLEE